MTRWVRPRKEWGGGKNTRMGGSAPIVPQNRGRVPAGFGGHSRLLLLEDAALVLAAQEKGIRNFVRQHVRQNRKGGTRRKHGDHQGTTEANKVSDHPGARRGVRENTARSIRKIIRLHSVLRHHGGS